MKKIAIILIIFVGLAAFVSCEKDETRTVLSDSPTAPAFTNLSDGSITLLKEDADKSISYEWSFSDFGFDASITYSLELDQQGNNFADPIVLGSINNGKSVSVLTSELNNKILELKEDPQDPSPLAMEFRVKASVSPFATPSYSSVVKQSITPYVSEIVYPPLYMLGDGCSAGWNNGTALLMEGGAGGVYTLTTTLGAAKFIKFITTLGQWAPMYGTDAAGTSTGGALVFRETEAVPDPPAIPTPATGGSYTVTADITNLTYTIAAKK